MSEGMKIVAVEPEAWRELNDILSVLTSALGVWSMKHDLPIHAGLGALVGVHEVVSTIGDVCMCDACLEMQNRMADEVVSRMIGTREVKH